jgi:hypothetical protein
LEKKSLFSQDEPVVQAPNSCSAKAAHSLFPSVEVIQERPVTNIQPVEELVSSSFARPAVAEPFSGKDPGVETLVEEPTPAAGRVKTPPFLLELFCGTAGVCAQFRAKGGRALGIDHHLKRTKLKSAAVKL